MFSKEQIQKDLAFLITDERVVNKLREIYFKKNYLVYYTEILKYTENYDMTFVQRVYHYFNQIKHPITETKCICCNKVLPVKFQFFKTGYYIKRFCNSKCQLLSSEFKEEQKQRNLEKYGVESTNAVPEIINKKKVSYENKTGYSHWSRDPKVREKYKQTILERYGSENIFQVDLFKEKIKQTMIARYGVDHNMKHNDLFKINALARFSIEQYENTNLYFQSTYEKLFIDEFIKKYDWNELSQDLYIPYYFDYKDRMYHPDFFIKSTNTIIEIKSNWTFNRNGDDDKFEQQNLAKRDACLKRGYNFEFLIGINTIQSYIDNLNFIPQY